MVKYAQKQLDLTLQINIGMKMQRNIDSKGLLVATTGH